MSQLRKELEEEKEKNKKLEETVKEKDAEVKLGKKTKRILVWRVCAKEKEGEGEMCFFIMRS